MKTFIPDRQCAVQAEEEAGLEGVPVLRLWVYEGDQQGDGRLLQGEGKPSPLQYQGAKCVRLILTTTAGFELQIYT